MALHSPQHFETERIGCSAAAGLPQLNDLHVRVLMHTFLAARVCVFCSSCVSRRASTLKSGVIGETTESRVGRPTFDWTPRLVEELAVYSVLCGGGPHRLVRVQNQPCASQTSGGDAQLRQYRARADLLCDVTALVRSRVASHTTSAGESTNTALAAKFSAQ